MVAFSITPIPARRSEHITLYTSSACAGPEVAFSITSEVQLCVKESTGPCHTDFKMCLRDADAGQSMLELAKKFFPAAQLQYVSDGGLDRVLALREMCEATIADRLEVCCSGFVVLDVSFSLYDCEAAVR